MLFGFRATIIIIFIIISSDTRRIQGRPQQFKSDCRFENRRYQEGAAVTTSEPCLQCRCIEGSLRCRLRVCPRLPNPPPPGCRARLLEENVCCSQLVCGESDEAENVLRSINHEIGSRNEDDGCLYQGVRYGLGSAMMGSRKCEYCYCISGTRRCIRPKCLLPLPGCTPVYAPHSCCPVSYNCTRAESWSTMASISGNDCRVGERLYKEGEMVRDIAFKAICDNCFCAMGVVRCVPLACAPPLQGCSPIVREGQCCPSTYNCSSSIEVKATQNYASYAFISKDYAKFRKETNFFAPHKFQFLSNYTVEGRGHRVVIEGIDSSTYGPVTEESPVTESTSVSSTFETETMNNKILTETTEYPKTTTTLESDLLTSTTFEESTDVETTLSDLSTTIRDSSIEDFTLTSSSLMSPVDSTTIDDSASEVTTTRATTNEEEYTSTLPSVTDITESALISLEAGFRETSCQESESDKEHFTVPSTNDTETTVSSLTIKKQNKVKDEDLGQLTSTAFIHQAPLVIGSPTVLMPDDILVMNVTVKTNVSVGHIQGVTINPVSTIAPEIEAILNITHRQKDDDYEYDYSEPTLPPSLPNVRIIPFVAADALVNDKNEPSPVTGYPSGGVGLPSEMLPTASRFYDTKENRFSPPVETEGGFVPREPPYFDPSYHSVDLNLEIGTGVTVLPEAIGNPLKKNDLQDLGSNCIFEGQEYHHASSLPSPGLCIVCICYYGEVICSDEKCSPLKIGCQRIIDKKKCCGKIVCVDAEESPTVVLDRADVSVASQGQPLVSSDPFRDVIKTEPAPDLPSLIEDMIPYLAGITTPSSTTALTSSTIQELQTFSFPNDNQNTQISDSDNLNGMLSTKLVVNNNSSETSLISGITIRNNKSEENHNKLDNLLSNSASSNKTEDLFQPDEDDSIFSLDKVLDLFFSDSTTERYKETTEVKNESEIKNKTEVRESSILKQGAESDREKESVVNQESVNHRELLKNQESVKDQESIKTQESAEDQEFTKGQDFTIGHESVKDRDSVEGSKSEQIQESIVIPARKESANILKSVENTKVVEFTEGTVTKNTDVEKETQIREKIDIKEELKSGNESVKDMVKINANKKIKGEAKNSSGYLSSNKIVETQIGSQLGSTNVQGTKNLNVNFVLESKTKNSEKDTSVLNVLKLAGCNIYGRMYRVGKIITELSTTCKECGCTEIGVQCKQLDC